MKKILSIVLIAVLCVSMVGCSGLKSIELASEGYIFKVGDSPLDISAEIVVDGEGELTYSSSDENVVKFSEDGALSVIGNGTATITVASAKNEDVKAVADVLVTDYYGVYACEKYVDAMGCDIKLTIDFKEDGTYNMFRYPMYVNLDGGGLMPVMYDGGTYKTDGNSIVVTPDEPKNLNISEDGFALSFLYQEDGSSVIQGKTPTGGAMTDMTFEKFIYEDRAESGKYIGIAETAQAKMVEFDLTLDAGNYTINSSVDGKKAETISKGRYVFKDEIIEFVAETGISFCAEYNKERKVVEGTDFPTTASEYVETVFATLELK